MAEEEKDITENPNFVLSISKASVNAVYKEGYDSGFKAGYNNGKSTLSYWWFIVVFILGALGFFAVGAATQPFVAGIVEYSDNVRQQKKYEKEGAAGVMRGPKENNVRN